MCMARRIRKQVYLDPKHEQMLKRQAKERGVTEAEVIRNALDRSIANGRSRENPVADLEAGRKLLASLRSLPGRLARSRRPPSRESLYEDRIARWTKS